MTSDIRLPEELIEAFAAGHGVLWLGAGCSVGSGLPSWDGLAAEMSRHVMQRLKLSEWDMRGLNNLEIAQVFRDAVGDHQYYSFLRSNIAGRTLEGINSSENRTLIGVCDLANHFWPKPGIVVVSTNYDHLFEETMLLKHGKRVRAIVSRDDIATARYDRELTVLKPNGDIDIPESIVLTLQEYCEFRIRKRNFSAELSQLVTNRTFLFVGYGLGDFTFNAMLGEVKADLGPFKRRAYAIALDDRARREIHRSLGVEVIPISNYEELPFILRAISEQQQTVEFVFRRVEDLAEEIKTTVAKWKILWIDDDEIYFDDLKWLAANYDWKGFEFASDARQALTIIEDRNFDIIVTDFAMPLVSGLEIIRAARRSKANRTSLVGVSSAYVGLENMNQCIREGADFILDKLVLLDELLVKLYQLKRLQDRA